MIRQRQFGQRKSFDTWYYRVICCSYYKVLRKFSIKIESNYCFSKTYSDIESKWSIKTSKEKIVLSRDNIYDYLCDVLYKLLIKAKSKWRSEIRKQTSLLTLLYCGWTVAGKFAVSEIYIQLGNFYCFKLASLVRNRV